MSDRRMIDLAKTVALCHDKLKKAEEDLQNALDAMDEYMRSTTKGLPVVKPVAKSNRKTSTPKAKTKPNIKTTKGRKTPDPWYRINAEGREERYYRTPSYAIIAAELGVGEQGYHRTYTSGKRMKGVWLEAKDAEVIKDLVADRVQKSKALREKMGWDRNKRGVWKLLSYRTPVDATPVGKKETDDV